MSDSDSEAPTLVQVATALLLDAGAELASGQSTLRAVQNALSRFREHLLPRIGGGGFQALVELARRRSIGEHPVLESVVVESEDLRIRQQGNLQVSTPAEGTLAPALIHFLAEVLSVVREVAQDQDWDLVEIWPGLEALRQQGLPLKPDPSSDSETPDRPSPPVP